MNKKVLEKLTTAFKKNWFSKILNQNKKESIKRQNPKKSCIHCHGRGILGFNVIKQKQVLCTCTLPVSLRRYNQKLVEKYHKKIGGFYKLFVRN